MLCFVEFNEDGSIRKIYGPFETAEAAYEWGTLHVKGLGHTRYEWHAQRRALRMAARSVAVGNWSGISATAGIEKIVAFTKTGWHVGPASLFRRTKMNNFSYGDVVKFVAEFADPTAPEKGTEGRVISSEIQGMVQVAWFPTKECPTIRRTWVWTDQIEKIHWSPCK